jgi:3-deoxy-D-manno-octulosonic-acid transferase
MVTYFSPSAIEMVQNDKFIDFSTPLPWDRPKIIDSFLKFHKPRALLIARTDAWPEMLMQAEMANIPAMMFAATLADKSSRMGFLSRHFSAWVLGMLNEIQCVSPADLNNFKTLGLGIITQVAGDTRYDQVIERLNHPKPIKTQLFENTENILVAGSTWPEDEAVLLQMYLKNPNIKLCIVPHEPTSSHLENIRSQAEALGLQIQLYTKSEKWRVGEILVVDQVGILAELYSHAQFAFVGGSFKKNVHSVMEPLAAGCVTFIGPKHQNNREALDIKKEKMTSLGGESAVIEVTGAEQWSQKFTSLTPYDFKRVKVEIKNLISQRSGLALKKALKWIEEKAL